VGIAAATRADLWAHAADFGARAAAEGDLPALRRALVTLAVAGAGEDAGGFRALVNEVCDTARRLGLDPVPLFDAAAALVAEDDPAAREALVLAPRREPPPNPLAGTPYGMLRPRGR
jgi:hypothetical protein